MLRPLWLSACLIGVLAAAEPADKDRIIQKNAPVIEAAEVVSETTEAVTYKITPNAQPATKRSSAILRVEYAGMEGGNYHAGIEALERGAYEEAADRFRLASQGEREWEKVYGSLAEGGAFEQAKRYADAAAAFKTVIDGFPKHRLALDASYRAGMNLALAKDQANATKLADSLSEQAKGLIGPPAESRANAIRAALALAGGNLAKVEEFARKVRLQPVDELDTWFHFNIWLAETFRKANKAKEAARTIDSIIPYLDGEPARKAQELGIKGLALIDSDPQGALVELIKLDVLPFGSEELRCEARYQAGRLLLAEAKTLAANPETAKDERKAAFVIEQRKAARLLLQASSDSLTTSPAKDQAKTLLGTLGAN
jgi:hypothetical protein